MSDIRNTRLICMDMDGTLFAGHETIPEINIQALRECEKRGIRIALVSGRNYRFLMENARKISDSVIVVSSNGARIDDKVGGSCIYEAVFDEKDAVMTSKVLWDTQVYYEIYSKTINYGLRGELIPAHHRASLERYLVNGHILGCEFPDRLEDAVYTGVYKFVCFSTDPEKITFIRDTLDAHGIVHSSSSPDNVETMALGVGKGTALRVLARHLGIPIEDTMAFGDYTNDCDMLAACGHPVAMENGVQVLKDMAEIIAPPNTEGGVGQVISKYVLGK